MNVPEPGGAPDARRLLLVEDDRSLAAMLDVIRAVAATLVRDRRTVDLPTGGFEILTVQRGDDTVQVMASTFEQHQDRGVDLRTTVDAAGPTVVHGATTALTRGVAALVDNALDHATGAVVVRVTRGGRSVVVEVLDDGSGIPSETLPRMFDRFASDRRPVAETGERRHFGLGLALVSEIATRHGGSVTAENRPRRSPARSCV